MRTTISWSTAESLREFGLLTARWLLGKDAEYPLYGGPPDPETAEILRDLLVLNRRGLVSLFSQPAEPIASGGSGQRSAFEGLAEEQLARRVAALTLYTDLLVFLYEPCATGGYQVPISTWEYHPYTWCGASFGEENIEPLVEISSIAGKLALLGAWRVVVIDPKWGRKRLLWNSLRKVTHPRFQASWLISPSPDLGLEADLVR